MAVFLTKEFARRAGLAASDLFEAGTKVAKGQADASLGHGIFKQRVARPGGGKSGGFRTIIVFKIAHDCFFVHGFAKNDKANISMRELKALKRLALVLLAFDAAQISSARRAGELIEVEDDGNEKNV